MNKPLPLVGTLFILFAIACIEPFSPELGEAQNILVIEGQVLEGNEPAEVRISRTVEVGSKDELMVSNAQVIIRDDLGGEFVLTEGESGVYQSDTNQLIGTPDTEYQLSVMTAAGQSYESTWEILRGTTGIERIHTAIEESGDSIVGNSTTGVSVLLDTRDSENNSRYYRWEWEETWEYAVPFPTYFTWDFMTNSTVPIPEEDWGYICWRNQVSSGILLTTTAQLEEDIIERQPIRFISLKTNRLSRKYSLLIKQYVLTQEAYSYWKSLEAFNENLGTLFDPIPYEADGNIRSTDSPKVPVIGYFGAYGFAKERFWMERQEVPQDYRVSSGYAECTLDSLFDYTDFVSEVRFSNYVYVDSIIGDLGQFVGWLVAKDFCTDCKLAGTNVKPDFWP